MTEIKKTSSVWKIGAVIAAIITILAAIPVIYMSVGQQAPVWETLVALLAPFPVAWLICSLLTWLWRLTGGSRSDTLDNSASKE